MGYVARIWLYMIQYPHVSAENSIDVRSYVVLPNRIGHLESKQAVALLMSLNLYQEYIYILYIYTRVNIIKTNIENMSRHPTLPLL